MTILINFGHPLTDIQRQKIVELSNLEIEEALFVPTEFDYMAGFEEQVKKLVDEVGLSAEEWQTKKILINPPSLNVIAMMLLAELHGRMGYFPSVVRLRPVLESIPTEFEVAEILNLQMIRDQSRRRR